MGLEGRRRACTNCGSPHLTEIGPDTYSCGNCGSESKFVDSSRIRVEHQLAFCACGNAVAAQCQVCREAICRDCNVADWPRRYRDSQGANPGGAACVTIPVTAGFGYLRKTAPGSGRPEEWWLADGRIIRAQWPGTGVIGPCLHVDDVLAQFGRKARGAIRNVCCACVTRAVPGVAKAIAAGSVCETPGCGAAAGGRCRCCRQAFCAVHLGPGRDAEPSGVLAVFEPRPIATISWEASWALDADGDSDTYRVPRPEGLCGMCALERAAAAEAKVLAICDASRGIARQGEWAAGFGYVYKAQPGFVSTARTIARRCAAPINDRLRELGKFPGECRRDQWFASVGAPGRAVDYLQDGNLGSFVYAVRGGRPGSG